MDILKHIYTMTINYNSVTIFLAILLMILIGITLYYFIKLVIIHRQKDYIDDEEKKDTISSAIILPICAAILAIIIFTIIDMYSSYIGQKIAEREYNREQAIIHKEIKKICFKLDETAVSDIKDIHIQNEYMNDLLTSVEKYYKQVNDLRYNYYNTHHTIENFNNLIENTNTYSVLYRNIQKIEKEIDKRKKDCLKNQCNKDYYNKNFHFAMKAIIQKFYNLNCNKTEKLK